MYAAVFPRGGVSSRAARTGRSRSGSSDRLSQSPPRAPRSGRRGSAAGRACLPARPGLRRSFSGALSSGISPRSTAGCTGRRESASRTPGRPLPASQRARRLRGTQKRQLKKSCLFSMAKARFSARGMACYIQEGISPAAVTPPPSGSRTGAAVRRSLRRGSCSSRYPPPSENNPSSRNERSPIFLMDTEIIAGSAHPGQQTAENIRKFSRRFRPDYTTFRPPRVNRRA